MRAERSSNPFGIAYLYDGTLEGLLSAVFLSYERAETPDDIVAEQRYLPRIGQSALAVETSFEKAARVRKGVEHKAGRDSFDALLRASCCENYEMGRSVLDFIRLAMSKEGTVPLLDDLANPVVAAIVNMKKRADNEAEKMRQFARFVHLQNGVWFAKCHPNASVVPLVMGHFAARYNDQPFIIYDERHHLAGVYDGRKRYLVAGDPVVETDVAADETLMQEAWKLFYDSLSIDARYNPELRRRFAPLRLWADLTEAQPRREGISSLSYGNTGS